MYHCERLTEFLKPVWRSDLRDLAKLSDQDLVPSFMAPDFPIVPAPEAWRSWVPGAQLRHTDRFRNSFGKKTHCCGGKYDSIWAVSVKSNEKHLNQIAFKITPFQKLKGKKSSGPKCVFKRFMASQVLAPQLQRLGRDPPAWASGVSSRQTGDSLNLPPV